MKLKPTLLSAFLVIALLAALLAQPAQAQTTVNCATYYNWRRGDTTGGIAHTYNLKWRKIAVANGLAIGERPQVGDRLCIPKQSTSTGNTFGRNPNAVFTVTVNNGRITINTSKFGANSILKAKVRSATTGVGGWTNLGTIRVDKGDNLSTVYSVPSSLRGKGGFISVCLKDQINDDLVCRNVFNQ